jgi:hypothetical protein
MQLAKPDPDFPVHRNAPSLFDLTQKAEPVQRLNFFIKCGSVPGRTKTAQTRDAAFT